MKKLISFLIKQKWLVLMPFFAFFTWAIGFLSSSLNRFVPYILEKTLEYFVQNEASLPAKVGDLYYLVLFIKNFVTSLDAWFPIYDFLSVFFFIMAWRFAYFGVRFFVKAVTVGQV